jgi:hypothetical protein
MSNQQELLSNRFLRSFYSNTKPSVEGEVEIFFRTGGAARRGVLGHRQVRPLAAALHLPPFVVLVPVHLPHIPAHVHGK